MKKQEKLDLVRKNINDNYNIYIKIVHNGYYFKNSLIKHNLLDVMNDVIVEIYEKFSVDELYKKTLFIPNKKTGTNLLDGLIIYMVNLNLYSRTSRHFKKYYNENKLPFIDEIDVDEMEDEVYDSRIDDIERVLDGLDMKYKYKKNIFKERWNIGGSSIEKITYKTLSLKYGIPINYIRLIVKEVEDLIIKKLMIKNEL